MSTLYQLSQLITASVTTLEAEGLHFPSLNERWTPQSEAFRSSPGVSDAVNSIVAAAYQLIATLLPGPVALGEFANSHIKSAALRIALESNTAEILRESGPKGLHADAIAEKAGVDAGKLARILRFLSTYHIFEEVTPDVFVNNRLSSILDTGKSHGDLIQSPTQKYDQTDGLTALIGHNVDECHKTSAFSWEAMEDPQTAFSEKPEDSAYSRAYGTNLPMFQSLELPENEQRLKRFGTAMQGVGKMFPATLITSLLDWSSLPKGSVVVDVGGGVGTSCFPLARQFPDLQYIIQDREIAVKHGQKLWETTLPHEISSGRVKFQEHDFFTPQKQGASVFFLKHVIHNWSDSSSVKILKELRRVASPETKLLIIDSVVPYACREGSDFTFSSSTAPKPLLPNYGGALGAQYIMDLQMMFLVNAQERTIGEGIRLLERAGWRLVKVHRSEGDELQSLEAVPV